MYLENIDRLGRNLDRLRVNLDKRTIYPSVEYKSHPSLTQSFFRELSNFLGDDKNVDLTYFLLKKYVLKK